MGRVDLLSVAQQLERECRPTVTPVSLLNFHDVALSDAARNIVVDLTLDETPALRADWNGRWEFILPL
jgi:hypothetical protein